MARGLTPRAIGRKLCTFVPDRDERASQVAMETFLSLVANDYDGDTTGIGLKSPKLARFALRSLVMKTNFLTGDVRAVSPDSDRVKSEIGSLLSIGEDFDSSENLAVVVAALRGLIDRSTKNSQPGVQLMYPFHELLLWYDSRNSKREGWSVRKVAMRGTGITLARLLSKPEPGGIAGDGIGLMKQLKSALQHENGVSKIAAHIDRLAGTEDPTTAQPDEIESWSLGSDPALAELGLRLRKFATNVLSVNSIAYPARLWSLRNMLGLEVALHILRRSYDLTDTAQLQRYMVVSIGGPKRPDNFTRQVSEASLEKSRRTIREALIQTISSEILQLRKIEGIDWAKEFEKRSELDHLAPHLSDQSQSADELARQIFESGTYGRPDEAFRRLIESIGALGGAGAYRFLEGTPDLFALLVLSMSDMMPMNSREFFHQVFDKWGLIIGSEAMGRTDLGIRIDASELARNARRAENMLVECGLAHSFSDSTTVVGQRVKSMIANVQ